MGKRRIKRIGKAKTREEERASENQTKEKTESRRASRMNRGPRKQREKYFQG